MDIADDLRVAQSDRPLPHSLGQRRESRDLGGVALLQRAVAGREAMGIHLVHSRRRRHQQQLGRQARHHTARAERRHPTVCDAARSVQSSFFDQQCRSDFRRLASDSSGRWRLLGPCSGAGGRGGRRSRKDFCLAASSPGSDGVLPGRGYGIGRVRLRLHGARPARECNGNALRRRKVRTADGRAVVSRPQLGSVARRHLGLGRSSRRRIHVSVWASLSGRHDHFSTARTRVSGRFARLPGRISPEADLVRRQRHRARRRHSTPCTLARIVRGCAW